MTVHYADDAVTLHHGKSEDVLRELPDASVDAVVTDPPYELGFMGKGWDASGIAYNVNLWRECLRILKPGGHLLAFGGTRTYHRLACAVEDAGFEIRDSISWLYGSGFPKSLDVSKAIDKARGDDPAWRVVGQWLKGYREAAGYPTRKAFAPLILDGHKNAESAAANLSNWENGLSFPTWEWWCRLKELLNLPPDLDAEVWRLNGRKGTPGEAWDQREVIGSKTAGIAVPGEARRYTVGGSRAVAVDITAPATDAARTWQGWGTALKPAHEPIVVARKPLTGTVAQTVLTHGTGALNIDATRVVAGQDYRDKCASVVGLDSNRNGDAYGEWTGPREDSASPLGRWPANVVLDEHAAAELDQQSGNRPGFSSQKFTGGTPGEGWGNISEPPGYREGYNDQGGASRFFPTFPTQELTCDSTPGGCVCESAAAAATPGCSATGGGTKPARPAESGAGSPSPADLSSDLPTFRYEAKAPTVERPRGEVAHPTVKPLDLMRWLVRLVTPPGGVVLDPFAGSGTTAEACVIEGFRCITIEREADYLPLILARLSKPIQPDIFGGAA